MKGKTMQISIGLPSHVPGVTGKFLLDWAKKADEGPFESLCTLDVITSPAYDPLIALAGVAAVTNRIRLMTSILVTPLHNPAIFAKQAASLDVLSGGRLSLGLAVGWREKDFQAVGVDFHQRGKIFDKQLETITRIWGGQSLADDLAPIGPMPVQPGGPRLLLGGTSPTAIKRIGQWGEGYISPGSPIEVAQANFTIAETAWNEAGRPGKPRLINAAIYALGEDAKERGAKLLHILYADVPPLEEYFNSVLCTSSEAIKNVIKSSEEIGVDEFIFIPYIAELDQIDRLLEALG